MLPLQATDVTFSHFECVVCSGQKLCTNFQSPENFFPVISMNDTGQILALYNAPARMENYVCSLTWMLPWKPVFFMVSSWGIYSWMANISSVSIFMSCVFQLSRSPPQPPTPSIFCQDIRKTLPRSRRRFLSYKNVVWKHLRFSARMVHIDFKQAWFILIMNKLIKIVK